MYPLFFGPPGKEDFRHNIQHTRIMGNILYIVAIVLVIGWAVGFFAFSAGGIIHVLLVIAVIAILFQVIRGRRVL